MNNMNHNREIGGPFRQPDPDGDMVAEESGSPVKEKEIAPDPISELTKEITALSEEYAEGELSAVAYVDRVVPLFARREDRIRHHHPKNSDVVKNVFAAKTPRLSAILHDFNFGDIVDTQHPLNAMSDDVKKAKSAVTAVVGYRFAYRPFLYAMTLCKSSRSWDKTVRGEPTLQYNREDMRIREEFWHEIVSLQETLGVSDFNKRAGLAALILLTDTAQRKMIQDVHDLLAKPGSVMTRAEEDFWEHYLIGKPRNEGIAFCRNYVVDADEKMKGAANDIYGAIGDRVVRAWSDLLAQFYTCGDSQQEKDAFLSVLRYAGEQLLAGKIQLAERAMQKYSRREVAHFTPQIVKEESEKKATTEIQENTQATEKEALEFLEKYKGHLLLNLESIKRKDNFDFLTITINDETQELIVFNVRIGKTHGAESQIGSGLSISRFSGRRMVPANFMKRIRFGNEYYRDRVHAQTQQPGEAIGGKQQISSRLVQASGALFDIGAVEALSRGHILMAARDFFKSDAARALVGDAQDEIVRNIETLSLPFEGISAVDKQMTRATRSEHEMKALEHILTLHHHVFIRPIKKRHIENLSSDIIVIQILGVVSEEDFKKSDRKSHAQATANGIEHPVLLTRRYSFSYNGELIQNMVAGTSSFARFEEEIEAEGTMDMGKYDEVTTTVVRRLRDEYKTQLKEKESEK